MPKIPLAFTTPSADGNAYPSVLDSTTRQLYYALSATADGAWYFRGTVPEDYASGAAFEVRCLANATTGVHRIGLDCAFVADNEDQDPTLTALTVQGVTVPGTAYLQDAITFSSGLPTAAAGDTIIGRVTRDGDGSGGTDSLAVPTLLDVVLFTYTA
jgi:hypothetical protein